jgi:hypothetical protein
MKFTGKDGVLRIYNLAGGYLEVHFSNMDFSAPIGRPKRDEILVMDRGNVDTYSHYISGDDMKLFDPIPISFSCFVDDITHVNTTNGFKEILVEALQCRDARNDQTDDTWDGFGNSTKGSTQNISGTYNPRFEVPQSLVYANGTTALVSSNTFSDFGKTWVTNEAANCMVKFTSGAAEGLVLECYTNTSNVYTFAPGIDLAADYGIQNGDGYEVYDNIRTVDVQFRLNGESNNIVWKYAEIFFPLDECTITEAEDAINMAVTGGVYGTITRHSDWQ